MNLDLVQAIGFIATVAFALALISFLRNSHIDHNTGHVQKAKLFINRFFHWFATILKCFYVFIFKRTIALDAMYLVLMLVTLLQFKMYNECFLSINEKQILNPAYVPGSDILFEPWLITTLGIKSISYVARPLEILNILFIASSLIKRPSCFNNRII
jgi:hypothetical protein